jgi:hypothetical protein
MQNKDNFRTRKDDGDKLGEKDHNQKLTKNPAPKEDPRESEMTPPENEVYVDLEPDELHTDDEPLDVDEEDK